MIKLTEHTKDMTQDNAIAHWNHQKLPMASMEDVGKAVLSDSTEAIEAVRKDGRGMDWFLSSTRIVYNPNNLSATIYHNFGSKYRRQTSVKLKEIPDYTSEPLDKVLATAEGLAYVRALFNLPKASKEKVISILEKLSGKSVSSIRFWTPDQDSRKSRPSRAVALFFDVVRFNVYGYGWIGDDFGFSRGVRF